nr:hypothetical protein BaRGS_006577 [Batillaria attramentaria]
MQVVQRVEQTRRTQLKKVNQTAMMMMMMMMMTVMVMMKEKKKVIAELLELFRSMAKTQHKPGVTTIGMVGYPNVGKSSTINAILKTKKVPVSATPGRTKTYQPQSSAKSAASRLDKEFFAKVG